MDSTIPHIGTLNEHSLHAALKSWYTEPGDLVEQRVDGYVVDIVRNDLLVEIQTGGFSGIKNKLNRLVESHRVRLVHPIPMDRWIVKMGGDSAPVRRRSPRHGSSIDLFAELVSFPWLISRDRFDIEVLLTTEEEIRRPDPRRWRRRGWAVTERRLLEVSDRAIFRTPADLAALLPAEPAGPFTSADLAGALRRPRRLAQQVCYCLRECGALDVVGKQGNSLVYARTA